MMSLSVSLVEPPVRVKLARLVSKRSMNVMALKFSEETLTVSVKEMTMKPSARSI